MAGRVHFAGPRRDVRPLLWLSDAFALPSAYETFSLVAFEAAAAGLPLVVTRLHGVEDIARDGVNALVVERSVPSLAAALRRLADMPPETRRAFGARAAQAVAAYSPAAFLAHWRQFYAEQMQGTAPAAPSGQMVVSR